MHLTYAMGMGTIIGLLVSVLTTLGCCAFGVFLILLVVGIVLLRRRGKQVTVKEAVSVGAESVSQVFVRGKGGKIEDEDDEDEDDK